MALSDDLLQQARRLATLAPRRPRQANLRRAISAAYYALFHELTSDGGRRLARGAARTAHRSFVRRSFEHGRMADVAEDFSRVKEWLRKRGIVPSAELRKVSYAFILLQQERHVADYDLDTVFARTRALEIVDLAEGTVTTWRSLRGTPEADFFLLAMLLGRPRRG